MPAASTDLYRFHEQRINDLDTEVGKFEAEQAKINTKLDGLTLQVQETREEVGQKLDKLLDRNETVAGKVTSLETRVEAFEKSRSALRAIAARLVLPVALVLVGFLTGAEGAAIWKAVIKLVGGE